MKTKTRLKNKILNWEKTGKSYVEWVAKTSLKDFFYKNASFENFSVWWITNLCNKDNVIANDWYYQLKDILFEKKKIEYNRFKFYLVFILIIITSLKKKI